MSDGQVDEVIFARTVGCCAGCLNPVPRFVASTVASGHNRTACVLNRSDQVAANGLAKSPGREQEQEPPARKLLVAAVRFIALSTSEIQLVRT